MNTRVISIFIVLFASCISPSIYAESKTKLESQIYDLEREREFLLKDHLLPKRLVLENFQWLLDLNDVYVYLEPVSNGELVPQRMSTGLIHKAYLERLLAVQEAEKSLFEGRAVDYESVQRKLESIKKNDKIAREQIRKAQKKLENQVQIIEKDFAQLTRNIEKLKGQQSSHKLNKEERANKTNDASATGSAELTRGGVIEVTEATYGWNCRDFNPRQAKINTVKRNNALADISTRCNGRKECNYTVYYKHIGDPAFGCEKDYSVTYLCTLNREEHKEYVSAEAGWGPERKSQTKTIRLYCY